MGKHKQQNTGQADASAQPREGATWAVHRVSFPPHSPHAAPRASQLPPPNFQVLLSTSTSWKEQGKGRGKGGAKNFLSALLPRACWWSATWTSGWEDETVGQTRDSLILWAEMGRLQTADTEKGELLQVRRLTTREHRLTARRWQSSWEEAPASGTQKVQQEFTMCKALKENPGRKRMQAHSPTDSGNRSRVTLKHKNVGGHVTIVRHQDFQITCTALSPYRGQVECLFHRVCFAQQCNILMILCRSFISNIY